MKKVFDEHYKEKFLAAGLLDGCGGDLQHLISDAATMQIIRWTGGGFGMAAHNYDGDMLTDEVAQVHRSPGFITSNLIGKTDAGVLIKEFEASHGTVADLWQAHLRGEETSFNPLGMVDALVSAMDYSSEIEGNCTAEEASRLKNFTTTLRTSLHNTFRYGQGTRDMSGPSGLTTEAFVDKVASRLERYLKQQQEDEPLPENVRPDPKFRRNYDVDSDAVLEMFKSFDTDGNGTIDFEEFEAMLVKLNVAPKKSSKEKRSDVG